MGLADFLVSTEGQICCCLSPRRPHKGESGCEMAGEALSALWSAPSGPNQTEVFTQWTHVWLWRARFGKAPWKTFWLQKLPWHGTVTRCKWSNSRFLLEWLRLVSVSFPAPSAPLCVLTEQCEWRFPLSYLASSALLSFGGCLQNQGNEMCKMESYSQQLLKQNYSLRNGTKEETALKHCKL